MRVVFSETTAFLSVQTSTPRTNRPLQCTTATSLFFSTSIVSMTDSLIFFS